MLCSDIFNGYTSVNLVKLVVTIGIQYWPCIDFEVFKNILFMIKKKLDSLVTLRFFFCRDWIFFNVKLAYTMYTNTVINSVNILNVFKTYIPNACLVNWNSPYDVLLLTHRNLIKYSSLLVLRWLKWITM